VDSFELLLNSAADLRVLARPPWLTLPRLLAASGVLAVILLGAMLWAFSLRRRVSAQTVIIRQKAQREAALEERTRIARDIHDDVGSSLARIAMLSELAEADKDRPEQVEVHVRKIAGSARATVRAVDEIIWAISPEHDTWNSLVEYLGRYASEFFEGTSLRCRLELPLDLPDHPLSSEARHALFLVIKEAFHNALKHSQASLVHLRVRQTTTGLEIAIADDGCGFNPDSTGGRGHGLANMRGRIAALGGEFGVESAPGRGTRLRILVRL
jgi:signal transduction histidine kinase